MFTVPFTPILILLTLLIFYLKKKAVRIDGIPGPQGNFLIGNAWEFIGQRNFLYVIEKWTKQYGRRITFRLRFDRNLVLISEAKDMQKILSSATEIEKSPQYGWLSPWLGDGLLLSSGAKWHQRRKLLTPSFHYSILEGFVETFNSNAIELVNKWRNEKLTQFFDCYGDINNSSLDVMSETSMGVKVGALRQTDNKYVQSVHEMGNLVVYRFLRPWLYNNFIWNMSPSGRRYNKLVEELHRFTDEVIRKRKIHNQRQSVLKQDEPETHDSENIYFSAQKRKVFLDTLLDAQADPRYELSDLDIREETDTFMFEGHDTTTSAVSFCLFCLGNSPDSQEKIYSELRDIVGDRLLDPNDHFTMNEIGQMKHLECCFKESSRLFPPVPYVFRGLKKDFVFDDGVVAPAQTRLFLNFFLLHRDEKVFPDPLEYKPSRFYDKRSNENSFAFVPFSAGPRNCIGQKFALLSLKTSIAHVIKNFKIESMEKVHEINTYPSLIIRACDGCRIKLTPRNNSG